MRASTRWGAALALAALLAFAGLGLARAVGTGAVPTEQQRVDAVSATLRCPTCQGLSIKDSPSVLAEGSRRIVEDQVREGRSDDEIRQYFVDRYGEYVLLSPDTGGAGLLVWLLPGLAVVGSGVLAVRWLRARRDVLPAAVGPASSTYDETDDETDGDALLALQAFAGGALLPDDSPAGESLREALTVRLALAEDDVVDRHALSRADLRLGAAYRRYRARQRRPGAAPATSAPLPRRTVTALTVALLVLASGTALALGVRSRGVTDLPTGDLPGGVPAAAQGLAVDGVPALPGVRPSGVPGLSALLAATRDRPDDPGVWIALGRAHETGHEPAKAVAAYDRALALRPADDVSLLRAGVLVSNGSAREALPEVARLAARYPDDADAVLLLGLTQEELGSSAAEATLRRYLQLAPDGSAAPGVRDLLARR